MIGCNRCRSLMKQRRSSVKQSLWFAKCPGNFVRTSLLLSLTKMVGSEGSLSLSLSSLLKQTRSLMVKRTKFVTGKMFKKHDGEIKAFEKKTSIISCRGQVDHGILHDPATKSFEKKSSIFSLCFYQFLPILFPFLPDFSYYTRDKPHQRTLIFNRPNRRS